MLFLELSTDTLQNRNKFSKSGDRTSSRAGASTARRPVRGLEIKEDTFAAIEVLLANGESVDLVDAGAGTGLTGQYTNFILQSVQEARMEKHQIIDTFGDAYLLLFGEAPRFIDVSSVLINSHDFNWEAEWWENYDRYLRGSKSAEMGAKVYLFYDDSVVAGYILQCQANKTSETPLMVGMNFRMFVTDYYNVSNIGDPNYPMHGNAAIPKEIDITQPLKGTQVSNLIGNRVAGAYNGTVKGALRSLIRDNRDEYVTDNESAADAMYKLGWNQKKTPGTSNLLNGFKTGLGVSLKASAVAGLGLQASFKASASVGIGAGVGAFATFGASANASVGAFASVGASASASAFAGFSANASASASAGYSASAGASYSSYAGAYAGAYGNASTYSGTYAGGFAGSGAGSLQSASANYGNSGYTYKAGYSPSTGWQTQSSGGDFGQGAGASVGGKPSAFGMVSYKDSFGNNYQKSF